MIPIIETEVVAKNKWIEKETFLDLIAIAQRGALCTAFGCALPSFLIILLIAISFHSFIDVPWVAAMFRGIRPAVVALIAVPTFNLAKSAGISLVNCWIPIACALLIWAIGVNPVFIIIAAGIGGYIYGQFIKPTEQT